MRASFSKVIYLPVSLNDSDFCRKAAEDRQKRNSFPVVNIIQNGWIIIDRLSDKLVDAYQNWPSFYKLHLHGFLDGTMESKIRNAQRMPHISTFLYSNESLPQILNDYDIGFVGYAERSSNDRHMENTSSQVVSYSRLGIPVIGCGSSLFNDFVNKQKIGIGISSIEEMEDAIKKIIENYPLFASNARKLYESRFNLTNLFHGYLLQTFESLFVVSQVK